MIALMMDGLELGKFVEKENKLNLELNKGIKVEWLPYIFELGYKNGTDMRQVINTWKKERVFPKNRIGYRRILRSIGLRRYNIDKIAEITRCSVLTDPYWIVYYESDTYTMDTFRGKSENGYKYNYMNIDKEEEYIWRI